MATLVKTLLVVIAFVYSLSAQASIEQDLVNICELVATDDRGGFRKKIRRVEIDYRLKLQDYYDNITCNGHSMIRTAMLENSLGVGTLIVKKLPRSHLHSPEHDGMTLQSWISQQGLEQNKIAKVLLQRL